MNELLQEMAAFAEANHVPIIRQEALNVLLQAVREKKPERILEIGTAIGYSALQILSAASPGAQVISLEMDEDRGALAGNYIARSPYKNQIEIILGDAGENILQLSGHFDAVFIDAAKGQYPDYLRKVLPLLEQDALILADNVLFRGYVLGGEFVPRRFRTIAKRLREYIDMVSDEQHFQTEIHEKGDGLAVSKWLG